MVAEAVAAPETSQWSLSALRDETLALCDRKNWPTNRLAAELGMLQSTVEKFLNGGAPSPRLRELLVSLMARQGIEPPLTEPAPIRPRSAIAYLAEQPNKPEPEPEAVDDEPQIEGVFIDPEAEAAAEDEARLVRALARAGDECDRKYDSHGSAEAWAVAVIAEARKQGVTLIAPPKPEPTYTIRLTHAQREAAFSAVAVSSFPGNEGKQAALEQVFRLLLNATPDATDAN